VKDLNEYLEGKKWYLYVPFWVFGLYLFIKLLSFELGSEVAFAVAVPQSVNFILHEMAHLVTVFLPQIMVAAAGSFSELLLGAALIVTAFKTRGYFASLFCCLWFMLACQSVADYMADARTQALPLVSFGGGDAAHDWHFIFGELGLLEQDTLIATITRSIGTMVGVAGLLLGAWLIGKMFLAKQAATAEARTAELKRVLAEARPEERPDDDTLTSGVYPIATKGLIARPTKKPEDKSS